MPTYLKHMGGYTYKQLKGKNFDEIQKLFNKEMKRVNTFVAMGSKEQESKEKKAEGSEETAKGSIKKMLGRKRAGKQQQQESSKNKRWRKTNSLMKLKKRYAGTLSVDKSRWKLQEILFNDKDAIRNRQRRLGGSLEDSKDKTSDVWKMLQGYRVTIWKLIDSSGVHFVRKVNERFECIPSEYDEEFVIKKLEDLEAEHQV
ncbi:hypothetical protein Tco_1275092 [Tanacetum coccineum]